MAQRVFNGTNYDTVLGAPAMGASNVSMSTSYQAGTAITAPNTSNKISILTFYLASVPTLGNIQIEVRESGVSKINGIANLADLKLGINCIKPATPYQFTTTSAGAYIPYAKNTTASSGTLARDGAAAIPLIAVAYDANSAVGATDDVIFAGFHDSGLTTYTHTITGTSNSWGAKLNKNPTSNTNRIWGVASLIGNGATLKFDTTADCKLTSKGNIFVMAGGLFDMRPGASSISTLEFENDADGDFTLMTASSTFGGQILTTGPTTTVAATYNGGAGTAADPASFTAAHGLAVGMEVVIGWASDYLKNEVRHVISVPSATTVVWSSTAGGAETALTHTHATGTPVANMTRRSIIKNTDTTKGFSVYHSTTNSTPASDFGYTRFEYANCLSGRGLQLSSTGHAVNANGIVCYNNSASGRISVQWAGSIVETIQDVIMYNTKGSNFSAQSGFTLAGASNKTLDGLYHYGEPSSTTNCAAVSVNSSSNGNTIKNVYSSGANAPNGTFGYAVGVFGSGNYLENIMIDAARLRGLLLDAGQGNTFVLCKLGTIANNTRDVEVSSGVLCQALFDRCEFGSTTDFYGTDTMIDTSLIRVHNYNNDDNRHRWYTKNGASYSSGAGLDKTTVATAGSLGVATVPLTAVGTEHIFPIPVNIDEAVSHFGRFWCNATFLAATNATLVAELYLPGSLTPDDTVTLTKTTDPMSDDAIFSLNAQNTSTVVAAAKIRLVAKNPDAVAGAEAYYDDMDGGTNSVTGLDMWYEGQPAAFRLMPQTLGDAAANAEAARQAILGDTDTWPINSKGRKIDDIERLADSTEGKVGIL